MKALIVTGFIFLSTFVLGQNVQLRKRIDSTVSVINVGLGKTISFFTFKKVLDKEIEFKYHCKYDKGQISYIIREFSNKDSSVKQIFYIRNSVLLFSRESIRYYYGNDYVDWGGTYYFLKGKLADHETLGHGKSEHETWNPEAEVLSNFQKAKADISKHLQGSVPSR